MTSAILLTLLLVDNGRSPYTIQIHREASAPERHAAAELARFLKEISGAALPIQEIDDATPAPDASIRVGLGAAKGLITAAESARLGEEGYILRSKGPTLVIAGGRPRGTLYGVYAFLEEQLGCRWFTPEVSRIPKKTTVSVRALDKTFVPPLEYRATDYPNSRDGDWAARNHINGTHTGIDAKRGGKIAYGPFVHTFENIIHPKDYFAKHPEYFSEINGKRVGDHSQLCLSNPHVLRIATETVRRWMREQPHATIFSVSQNDWYNYCTCQECSKIVKEEGSQCGLYLRFVNAIADAVRDEFPGKAVDTLAYQFTRPPPTKVKPRPNVIVRLCNIECCFAHPLNVRKEIDARNAAFARDLRRWGEISNRLYIWDYVINYAHSIMPFPNLYALRPNIQFFIANGVRGIYEEANYFSKGGEFAELRTWILAKTLWDPNYDTDQAIDEFLDGYYEGAAVPLRRYIDLIHGKTRMDNIHFHIYDSPFSPLFADEIITRANALFEEAEKKVADKPAVLHRVQVARLPITYVQIAKGLSKLSKQPQADDPQVALLQSLFTRFDAVARKEGVSHISEGRRYDAWAADVQKRLGAGR